MACETKHLLVALLGKCGPHAYRAVRSGQGRCQYAKPIIETASTQNFARLLAHTESLWRQLRPHAPSLRAIFRQLHKDFVPGLEAARADCMPHARPCDDDFHLQQRENGVRARCKAAESQNERMIKPTMRGSWPCLTTFAGPRPWAFSLLSGLASQVSFILPWAKTLWQHIYPQRIHERWAMAQQ